eukprot:scaffold139639_cov130-Phaeocystis_antarctica.AAC.1
MLGQHRARERREVVRRMHEHACAHRDVQCTRGQDPGRLRSKLVRQNWHACRRLRPTRPTSHLSATLWPSRVSLVFTTGLCSGSATAHKLLERTHGCLSRAVITGQRAVWRAGHHVFDDVKPARPHEAPHAPQCSLLALRRVVAVVDHHVHAGFRQAEARGVEARDGIPLRGALQQCDARQRLQHAARGRMHEAEIQVHAKNARTWEEIVRDLHRRPGEDANLGEVEHRGAEGREQRAIHIRVLVIVVCLVRAVVVGKLLEAKKVTRDLLEPVLTPRPTCTSFSQPAPLRDGPGQRSRPLLEHHSDASDCAGGD